MVITVMIQKSVLSCLVILLSCGMATAKNLNAIDTPKNNTYMGRKIIHVFEIKTAAGVVIKALSTIDGLSSWWTTNTKGTPEKDGVIQFRFANVFKPDMKVAESSQMLVKWKCIDGEKDWLNDTFTFSLEQKSETVKVTFTQEYQNPISDETYGRFNYNWGYYLHSLKMYCETGKGAPFQDK
jgi:hypothetical protein